MIINSNKMFGSPAPDTRGNGGEGACLCCGVTGRIKVRKSPPPFPDASLAPPGTNQPHISFLRGILFSTTQLHVQRNTLPPPRIRSLTPTHLASRISHLAASWRRERRTGRRKRAPCAACVCRMRYRPRRGTPQRRGPWGAASGGCLETPRGCEAWTRTRGTRSS